MSAVIERPRRGLAWYELKQEIEEFLYHEADLLDQRRFREWLDLLAEDLVYFMPVRRNVKFGQHAAEVLGEFGYDKSEIDALVASGVVCGGERKR